MAPMTRRWPAALLAILLAAAAVPAGARQSAPSVSVPDEPRSWRDRAALVMVHGDLFTALQQTGGRVEPGAEIYAAEVVPGVGQPALVMFDAGQGAFSQGFWPASSVKLIAAVAALESAGERGFDGEALVSGAWVAERTIRSIYEPAIINSDNHAYDLLVRIAGIDYLNRVFAPARGLGSLTIGSDYSGTSVLVTPAYSMRERIRVGQVPVAMRGQPLEVTNDQSFPRQGAAYWYRSNNVDLFDLAETVRRVMLHDEIPEDQRFAIADTDVAALQAALCAAEPAHFEYGARRLLGDDVEVCGKSGWWDRTPDPEEATTTTTTAAPDEEGGEGGGEEAPPPLCIDAALISDPDTGRRVVLAATGGCGGAGLAALAEPALKALSMLDGTPLQEDAGIPIGVSLEAADGMLRVRMDTESSWVSVRVDTGGPVLAARRDGAMEAVLPLPANGPHLLVVTAHAYGLPVGYRAVDFDVSGA